MWLHIFKVWTGKKKLHVFPSFMWYKNNSVWAFCGRSHEVSAKYFKKEQYFISRIAFQLWGEKTVSQEGTMRNKNIIILVSLLETCKKRRNFDYVKHTRIMIRMSESSYQLNHTSMTKKMDTFPEVHFDVHLKKRCFSNPKYMCLCLSW